MMKRFRKPVRWMVMPVLVLAFAACDRYHDKTTVKEKEMKTQERIYGDVGGPARQTKQEYPDNPDLIELQQKTKVALYYDQWDKENPFEESADEEESAEPAEAPSPDTTATMDTTAAAMDTTAAEADTATTETE